MSYLQETYHLFMKWFEAYKLKRGMTVLIDTASQLSNTEVYLPDRKIPWSELNLPNRKLRWILVRQFRYGTKLGGEPFFPRYRGKWWARPVCKPHSKPILLCFDCEVNTQQYKLRDSKGKPLYD